MNRIRRPAERQPPSPTLNSAPGEFDCQDTPVRQATQFVTFLPSIGAFRAAAIKLGIGRRSATE